MKLRNYQQRAIDMLYKWFEENPSGNPVLNMPGGSGKSVVIASVAEQAVKSWPDTKILMLVHSRELVAQNAEKLLNIWPNAPLGVYSASLNSRDIGEAITYASIQSVHTKADLIGHIDLCIVDEAHAISNKDTGTYRKLIAELTAINPHLRVIGFSASPYRTGSGMITDGDEAIFKEVIEPVTIEELVFMGHLSPLRSKMTGHLLDSTGLKKRSGDFIASEMEKKYNTSTDNVAVASEMIARASDRNHWLVFCSGIRHAQDFAETLINNGVSAHYLTGKDSSKVRDQKIADFENGTVRAMCNVGILTTGYDFPALDCIAFLRSTDSPGLYLQCAVRGMRIAEGKDDCLVLDFAGNVRKHGPITAVQPPKTKGKGSGEAPVKSCPECGEAVHLSAKQCSDCGFLFPIEETKKEWKLYQDDIMGLTPLEMNVTDWAWRIHKGYKSGKDMIRVDYYENFTHSICEYLTVEHDGFAGRRGLQKLHDIAKGSDASLHGCESMGDICERMKEYAPPSVIKYRKKGKLEDIITREWL